MPGDPAPASGSVAPATARTTTRPAAARVRKVTIPSPIGGLEGVYEFVEGVTPRALAVVCHPHPLFAGTMHNKVVFRTAEAFQHAGFATLRFNFRGVGASPGTHDDGQGEQEDARAAIWAVAPGVGRRDFSHLALCDKPKGVVQGTADELCPVADLERAFPAWADPKAKFLIDGADHFFNGKLREMQEALHTFLASPEAASFRAAVDARS